MKSTRLEAFSDGVIAIIITIMVLELKAPHDAALPDLLALWPVFLSYVLSFLMVAIYWVNHHHLIHLVQKIDGLTLWANMHLLFWLSLTPFATAYLGETHGAKLAVAVYGGLMLFCSLAYHLLHNAIVRNYRSDPVFVPINRRMVRKVCLAHALYGMSVLMAFACTPLALLFVVLPPLMYFMPDRAIEECEEVQA
jgi:uncharacterized membrane protein